MKKKIAVVFMLICALSVLMSCDSENTSEPEERRDGGNAVSDNINNNNSSENEAPAAIVYESDAPVSDFGGRNFTVLIWENFVGDMDFTAEEMNGDPINDAVYMKNLEISEIFNLNITTVGIWPLDHVGAIRRSVSAGDNSYDIAMTRPFEITALSQEGLLHDLNKIENLDLSQSWWDQNAVNDLSIMNKLFMTTGDMSMMYKRTIGAVLFNKKLMAEFDLGNPYSLVEQNNWTMDAFLELAVKVSHDLNGNGIWDDEDRYGILGQRDITSIALIGGGVKFMTKNADDIPELTFRSERTFTIFEKLTDIIYRDGIFWSSSINNASEEKQITMFTNDQFLFQWAEFHYIPKYRVMDTDFGILPMPKYNSSQERYYHAVNPHVTPFVIIPIANPDPEATGAVLAHMGAISKNQLTPAYYELSLKGKHARDEESRDMLDLIFSTMTYDTGHIYGWGDIGHFMHDMADAHKTNLISRFEAIENKVIGDLEKTLAGFERLDE